MPSKLENSLSLIISVSEWVGSVLSSGLTFNLTQLKLKLKLKVDMLTEQTLHVKKIILTQKRHCEVSIIIAMN